MRTEKKRKRYPARVFFVIFMVLASLTSAEISHGQNYSGQQVEVMGSWNGEYMEVEELEEHDQEEDPDWGQIEGCIDTVDIQIQTFRIGPMTIKWNDLTEFRGITEDNLVSQQPIKVSGKLVGFAHLAATAITAVSSCSSSLEITGVVTKIKHLPGGSIQLTLLGVPIELSSEDVVEVRELEERPDEDINMDEMYTVTLFERPLSIGLEYESNVEFFKGFELEKNAEEDLLIIEQILIPEVFYPLTDDISLFISLELFFEGEYQTEKDKHDTVTGIDREEMWLFAGNLFESGFSLQIGRQAVEEARQWWWGDEELDAFRVHYDRRHLHAELLVGQELGRSTTAEKRMDPEDEDLLRVMGQLAWGWEDDHRLDAFFLYQYDHSSKHSAGEIIREELEDPSDGDLLWIGGRASGKQPTEKSGEVEYWLDVAGVFGEEELFEFEEEDGLNRVSSHIRRDVVGWGFDVGITWWTDLRGRPFFNLGYAWGSGDRLSDPGKDQSFRQTGLHGSDDRFSYYGILLDPELSNLQIRTALLGSRFSESSLIAIAYHDYRQVKTSSFLRGAEIEEDLEGNSRDIGREWDLVVIFDDWDNMELRLFGAMFRAGSAYGSLSGEKAYYTGFELNYRF